MGGVIAFVVLLIYFVIPLVRAIPLWINWEKNGKEEQNDSKSKSTVIIIGISVILILLIIFAVIIIKDFVSDADKNAEQLQKKHEQVQKPELSLFGYWLYRWRGSGIFAAIILVYLMLVVIIRFRNIL
ncbi:MAG: hypothetical protein K8S56_02985 [Candidatus Cloacimonetes bacterium]|nr:hypothetical protein [Candidatus Cloacimonadota bacterium]